LTFILYDDQTACYKLEDMKGEFKEVSTKCDKVEVAAQTFLKKKDFEDRIEKIEMFYSSFSCV